MDQSVDVSLVSADREPEPTVANNEQAHIASKLGIVGFVLVAGVMALAANALVIALTTPDFMPDDVSDDPFITTCIACLVPFLVGCIGLGCGIAAVRAVGVLGERNVAIRGLVFGIVTVVLSIAIGVVFFNFDLAAAACGGG